ncbi:MAG: ABC transporter permease [Roseateles asaccharophilus]|uniref:Nucleoside ABC transporter membrane protein n=1 Tax=Roseateles asaccharophilus TaxID=582607 RepID=A0A4V3CK56_9BURK|nr:ABC transporter permease [Roseateles asaccharophilus]MDN3543456.1 ABC transporter permease [Roseateles asaccharophilus]TDP12166.1 nucleoside ABC transporter membrane protein [Roseateles asaccharophilus]
MDEVLIGSLLGSTLRVTTPLLLCALAGMLAERSGVIDLGLEGKMLFAAFAAAATASVTQSTGLGLLAAIAVASSLSMVQGFACVTHRGDQVVTGVALNMVAAGLTVVLGIAWFAQGGQTPPVPAEVRLTGLSGSYGEPQAGDWFASVVGHGLLSHNALVYLAFFLVVAVWFFLERTKPGLRLRAVGENPAMVDAAGVSVPGLRYSALMMNAVLCGLAGSYLTLAQNANFSPNMTAGRGYIALAAMIFGKWKPVPTMLACLLFGFLDAVAIRLQGVVIPGIGEVPVQLIQALPYILTVILLAGFIGQALAPKALGRPYVKER